MVHRKALAVIGPILFTLYTSPIHSIVENHVLHGHYYADDTQIYISCTLVEITAAIQREQNCLVDMFA